MTGGPPHPAPGAAIGAEPGPRRRARRIVEDTEPRVLERIRAPGIAAAIWRRPLAPGLADWLAALPAAGLPRFRARLAVQETAAAVDAACGIAGLPPCPARTALASDLATLAAAFGRLIGRAEVAARLEVIDTDACRRFHADRVPARLLCTLRGPGTELGLAGGGREVRIRRRLAAGEVAVLRGTLWPGEETGLLHRSPPIEGTAAVRLLWVLDPPPDAELDGGCCGP